MKFYALRVLKIGLKMYKHPIVNRPIKPLVFYPLHPAVPCVPLKILNKKINTLYHMQEAEELNLMAQAHVTQSSALLKLNVSAPQE
jgi:hypothetical protein